MLRCFLSLEAVDESSVHRILSYFFILGIHLFDTDRKFIILAKIINAKV